jgi:hypothetical protein
MRPTRPALALLAALALVSARSAAQDFAAGEIYIVSNALSPNGFFVRGVTRIEPYVGTPQLVRECYSFLSNAVYDPFRGRILVNGAMTNGGLTGLWAIDAAGGATLLTQAVTGVQLLAVAPQGRVYLYDNLDRVRYLDAANGVNDVLNVAGSGVATFTPPGNLNCDAMYYDAATNSVFFGHQGSAVCGSATSAPYIAKIPLLPGGTQVAGPATSAAICVPNDSGGSDPFHVNDFTPGPGGSIFATFDSNSYVQAARMMTIDPATLIASTYAKTTTFFGNASCNAGCYSNALGRGLILETLTDKLRAFSAGAVGEGATLASGPLISAGGSSGETTYVFEIPFGGISGLANYGTGTPGCDGPQIMGASSPASPGNPNFRLTTTSCPPSSLGLGLVANVADPVGFDTLSLGFLFHLDLFLSTELVPLDLVSNTFGYGLTQAAIPISPVIVGNTYYAQSIWVWSGCSTSSPYGFSSSNGLAIVIQP